MGIPDGRTNGGQWVSGFCGLFAGEQVGGVERGLVGSISLCRRRLKGLSRPIFFRAPLFSWSVKASSPRNFNLCVFSRLGRFTPSLLVYCTWIVGELGITGSAPARLIKQLGRNNTSTEYVGGEPYLVLCRFSVLFFLCRKSSQ